MKAIEYNGDLNEFLRQYRYQPDLTRRLDHLDGTDFNQPLINEIVLWKVNRYVAVSPEILRTIENARNIQAGHHRDAQEILEVLLKVRGVDLPMASTFLRFRNPKVFQIIDRHAYRAVFGHKYPLTVTSPIELKISTYFEYIDKLIDLCTARGLDFKTIDRLLYQFDKKKNRKL